MIWSPQEEIKNTLHAVEQYAESLIDKSQDDLKLMSPDNQNLVLPGAPGSQRDLENHQGYFVDVSSQSPIILLPIAGQRPLELFRKKTKSEDIQVIEILSD